MKERTPRQKAILRRRIFISCCAAVLVIVIVGVSLVISAISKALKGTEGGKTDSSVSEVVSPDNSESVDNTSSEASSVVSSDTSKASSVSSASSASSSVSSSTTNIKLDPNFSNLLLVNADNPLPDDYDSNVQKDLVEIDAKYRNNNYVTKIHKDVYPYITAMVAAAQAEGVDLRVWSPFRSYAIQKDLFQKQVNRVGGDEALAATVVARPGTSEHNTGLCADFNMASDAFANTKMYTWMTKNAENYGFIMRYSAEKKPITGVIHESWHWRFVGINVAKEMNKLGMCLEEYVEYKK
ncbi:MAG: M15 family metallopeptidase [Clostridia bacterium]|nr:M15 family metallopeptidase [Clostridia bacterium]